MVCKYSYEDRVQMFTLPEYEYVKLAQADSEMKQVYNPILTPLK